MILLLPTVKHTGSYFVLKHLLKGWECLTLRVDDDTLDRYRGKENAVIFDHLYRHKMKIWQELFKKFPAIVPLREKSKVWESWLRRNETDKEEFDKMWKEMQEFRYSHFEPFIINIDNTNLRDIQLMIINKTLDLNLEATGWPVVRK